MSRKSLGILAFSIAIMLSLTSCGSEDSSGSADIEFDVSDGGMLLPVDNETCVDKVNGDGSRSATSISMNFGSLRLKWIPKNKSLYVGLIRFTVKSSRITDGEQEFTLSGDEIEALLGAEGQIITPDEDNGNKSIVSNKSTNRDGYPNCAVNVGGIELADSSNTTSFSATVTVELIGQGSGSDDDPEDGADPYVVRKSYSTTATYY